MQTTRVAGRPAPRIRVRAGVALGGAAALLGGLVTAAPAQAVAGAAFTTNADGQRVNQNQYASKCDVHINGGPNNGANNLTDGTYFFTVLSPGGQLDPNDGGEKVLYDDSSADRTFAVTNGKITTGASAYASVDDASTQADGDLLVQLCRNPGDQTTNFADTANPGGVYILAICAANSGQPVRPRDCKYDAFKVQANDGGGDPGDDLVAIKDAVTSYDRAFNWEVGKVADKTSVSQIGGEAVFEYRVQAVKSAPADSGFTVSGQVTVFNPNGESATGVEVTDRTLGVDCEVRGGSDTIAANASATFTYTCPVSSADEITGTTSGVNVATVTWDPASVDSPSGIGTAEAAYDFNDALPNVTGNSTDVTDSFNGGTPVTLATGLTTSTTLTSADHEALRRTIAIPASNCLDYTNTATVTQSGDSATAAVRVCGPNRDGYTIGFWKNNSAKVINSTNLAGYCSAVLAHPAVLTGAKCATVKELTGYISKTMADGESSGTGMPMLKAQFLATVLNVQRTPALGLTTVLLTPAEQTALGVGACTSVKSLLSTTNAKQATSPLGKADVVLVKDIFDRINNNTQLTC